MTMTSSAVAKLDKCGTTSAASERQESIRKTIQRREECRKKAARIVEEMLEDNVSRDRFLVACHSLSQQDYEDAVQERAIILQCGYPICQNRLSRVPRQKYHICAKTNRVFDISERKHYCSDSCYHASVFLKKQLCDGPLWLRDETEAQEKYELLEKEKHRGIHGEVVDIGWRRLRKDEVEQMNKPAEPKEYLKTDGMQISPYMTEGAVQKLAARVEHLNISEEADAPNSDRGQEAEHIQPRSEGDSPGASPSTSSMTSPKQEPGLSTSPRKHKMSPSTDLHEKPNSGRNYSSWMNALNSERSNILTQSLLGHPELSLLENAEKTLYSWTTVETLTFLLGRKAVEQIKASNPDFGICSEGERKAKHFRNLYARICRKLDRIEAEEEDYSSKVLDSDDDDDDDDDEVRAMPKATMPSMKELQHDADKAQLRVYGFYMGELETPDRETGISETVEKCKNQERDKATRIQKKVEKKKVKSKAPDGPPGTKDPILPVVDSHAQTSLRCRVLLDRMRYVLSDIVDLIGVELAQVSTDLRDLITSFRLTAENVTLKMQTCKIVALCLTLMLSKRNVALQVALQGERQRSLLEPFLDSVGITLTDAEHLVERILSPGAVP